LLSSGNAPITAKSAARRSFVRAVRDHRNRNAGFEAQRFSANGGLGGRRKWIILRRRGDDPRQRWFRVIPWTEKDEFYRAVFKDLESMIEQAKKLFAKFSKKILR
jgi:hypothetical protein